MYKLKFILTIFVCTIAWSVANAQSISGPSTAALNDLDTYSITFSGNQFGPSWSVTGGTLQNSSISGTTYTATVKWTTASSSNKVTFSSFGGFSTSKTVNVTPPALSGGTISGNQTICYGADPSTLSNTGSASGGTGSNTYQWQYKFIISGSSWTNISGATGTSYNPSTTFGTTTRDFRRRVINGGQTSYSNTVRVTVRSNLNAGSISGAQTVCYNGNPSAFSNSSSASGANGSYTYQWQWRSPGGSWSNISGATSTTYNHGNLTATKEFRRRVISCGQTKYTNTVKVTVRSQVNAGSISGSQTLAYNANPSSFTNSSSASGANGSYAYQWQWRSPGGSWSNISGATSTTYNHGNLTSTKQFRRRVISCGQTKYSNTLTVTIRPQLTAGSIGGAQTLCYGSDPSTMTNSASPTGGTGNYAYQWQYKFIVSGSSWTNLSGATSSTYNPSSSFGTTTRDFRRRVISDGQTKYSNTIRKTIRPNLTGGSIGGTQTLCYNGNPPSFTSSASAGGGDGSYSYQWQWRSPGGSWANISGKTSTTHNHGNLTSTKEFRRRVISCGQTKYSNTITVTIRPNLSAGSIGGSQTLAYNGNPAGFTNSSSAGGGNGSFAYQWQWRSPGGSWSNISGATSTTYNHGNLTSTKQFRRRVISCGQTKYTNTLTVTIRPQLTAGSITGAQTLCYGDNPGVISNSSSPTGGTGSYSYQWQYKFIVSGSSWTNISGATSSSYDPPSSYGTTTRDFRRRVISDGQTKYSNTIRKTVRPNLVAGSIGGSQTLCYNGNPSAFTNSSSASGSSGNFNYQWQWRSPGGSWTDISGATSTTYDHGNLTSTKEFRREVFACNQTKYTNTITVTIRPNLTGGSIGGSQTLAYNGNPAGFTNSSSAGGGNGSYTYQWQWRSPGGSWTNITNATSTTYNHGALTSTKEFRRRVISCGQTKYSNTLTVTIRPQLTAGSITGAQTLCYGDNPGVMSNSSSPTGGTGSYSYQWQYKFIVSGSSWTNISGATSSSYDPPSSYGTTTRDFRRRVISDGQTKYSNTIRKTVRPNLVAGSIGGSQTLCYNGNPSAFTNSSSASGSSGNFNYQWQWRSPGGSWTDISGATSTTYDHGNLTSTKEFRREVFACNQTKYTNTITVTVHPNLTAGSIGGSQTLAYNGNPSAFTNSSSAGGGDGSLSYRWQWRSPGGSWASISGANSSTYNHGNLTATKEFRRRVQSCGFTKYTNTVTVTIRPQLVAGSIGSAQTICNDGDASTLTSSSAASGGNSTYAYQWEYKLTTSSSWATISGATSTTYNPPASHGSSSRDYRRRVQSDGQTKYSNTIRVTVRPELVAGSIGGGQTVCNSGNPSAFTNAASASGGNGSYSYQWQIKPQGGSWTSISGATSSTFDQGTLTQTTDFRRRVISCGETKYSNTVTVTVNDLLGGGTITGNQSFCDPTTATISNGDAPSGASGTYTISWQSRTPGGSWSNVTNGTNTIFITQLVSETTEYRRVVTSCGETGYSNTVTITIDDAPVGGNLIVSGGPYWNSATGTITFSNHSGNIIQWEQEITPGNWSAIANTTSTHAFSNISTNRNFRVKIGNGVCTPVYSDEISVLVNQTGFEGYLTGPDYVVGSINSGTLTLTNFTGKVEQWEYYDEGSLTTQVVNSELGTYDFADLVNTRHYRVKLSSQGDVGYTPWKKVEFRELPDTSLPTKFYSMTEVFRDDISDEGQINELTTDMVKSFSYADGLGRGVQSVVKGQSAGQNDIISFQQYDHNGASTKSYLPHTGFGSNYYSDPLGDQTTFYNNRFPGEAAYAESVVDDSPYRRVLEQGSVGNAWQIGTGNTVKSDVTYNEANQVRKWKSDGTSDSYYAANTLLVSIVTDENGNKIKSFVDSRGLTILKQVEESANTYLSTYSIYDDLGKLLYTMPPKAVETGILDANHASLDDLVFKYIYDEKGRLIEKIVPGAAPEYIVYDPFERVALTQDGILRNENKWFFSKSDKLGRLVYSGIYTNTTQTTRGDVQALFDALDYNTDPYYEKVTKGSEGYTNNVFPTNGLEILSVSYYDNYDFNRDGNADYTYDNAHLTGQEESNTLLRGMATGSKTKILDSNDWLIGAVFYDEYGRAVQTQGNNHLNLAVQDKLSTVYKENGELDKVKKTINDGTNTLNVLNSYTYDHSGRVLSITQQNNSDAPQLIAEYTYNELGQLTNKDLHDNGDGTYLQSVDYAYNIRGWLKSINDPDQITPEKLFGMELFYNDNMGGAMSQTARYNGRISAIKWKNNLSSGSEEQAYTYTYDGADRIKTASYGEGTVLANSGLFSLNSIDYDANGNITSLSRNAPNETGVAQTIDNLTYTYQGNQMIKVDDASGSDEGFKDEDSETEYTYDDNGNIISDANKEIDSIQYNELNKPEVVTFNDGRVINYTYSASGSKLSMAVDKDGTVTTTDYLGDMVYENNELQTFKHPEGRVAVEAGSFSYQYTYTDHLGNVRMVYETPETVTFTATMESETANQVDDALFSNISPAVDPDATSFDEVARLNSATPVGPGIGLPVYPGDKVSMNVQAYHRGGSDFDNSVDMNAFITALAGAFGGLNGGTATEQNVFNNLNNAVNPVNGGFGLLGNSDPNRPAAYLNYILFDKHFNMYQHGHAQISASGALETLSLEDVEAQEEGFVYVYLSNESNSLNEVYFDDLVVTIDQSPVIQNSDYYPFGLKHSTSWTRPTDLKNIFLFNAGSELNEETKNYETFYRQYDPVLGRMASIDPVAAKYSPLTPYNYSFNDPVALNDPMGDDPWKAETWAQSMGYFWDKNPDWKGDHRPGPKAVGNRVRHDVLGRLNNWFHSTPEYQSLLAGRMSRYMKRAIGLSLVIDISAMEDGYYNFGFENGQLSSFSYTSNQAEGIRNGIKYMSEHGVLTQSIIWDKFVKQKGKDRFLKSIGINKDNLFASLNQSDYFENNNNEVHWFLDYVADKLHNSKFISGRPNLFYKAAAIWFDVGGSVDGSEWDMGLFFILIGKDKGKIYRFDEMAVGYGTDSGFGAEIGRVDMDGNPLDFKARYLYGFRQKVYLQFAPMAELVSVGGSFAWSTTDDGHNIYAKGFQVSGGASVIPYISAGYNAGMVMYDVPFVSPIVVEPPH